MFEASAYIRIDSCNLLILAFMDEFVPDRNSDHHNLPAFTHD